MDQATLLPMPISPTNLVQLPSTINNHHTLANICFETNINKKHLFVGPSFIRIESPTTTQQYPRQGPMVVGDFGGDIHFDEDEDWTTNVRFCSVCTAVPP